MTSNGSLPWLTTAAVMVLLCAGCAVFSSDPDPIASSDPDLLFAPQEEEAPLDPQEEEGAGLEGAELDDLEEEAFSEEDETLKKDLREQRVTALVGNFMSEGQNFLDQGLLPEAQEQFAHALELDPSNEEARDLFNQVSTELGVDPEEASSVSGRIHDKLVVRRAQNQLKAEELEKAGRMAMVAEDYETAIKQFEDALLIVRWNPYLDKGALEEGSLAALLETATKERDRQTRERDAERQKRAFKQQQDQEKAERELLSNRIARLFTDANDAFMKDQYKESELYLSELLKIDPTNDMALDLRDLSMRTRHAETQRQIRSNYKKQWRATFDELEYDDLPAGELIQFPSDAEWDRISARGRSELAASDEASTAEDKAVLEKLATTPVAANFEQASLEEVVEYFKATTGVNFLISPIIIESGDEPLFDLVTPPRPALDQIDLLLSLALPPLKYKIQNGVVTVLSEEEPLGEYILDVYDIRDLSKVIANFPARDFNLQPSTSIEEEYDDDEEQVPEVYGADDLAQLIQDNIEPSSWDNAENTITPIGHFLVVRQSRKVHGKINGLLQDLRKSVGILINIETRFISVEDNFLEDIGVDFRGLDGNVNDFANPLSQVPNVLLDDFGDGSVPGGYGSESDPDGLGTGNEAGVYYDDGGDGALMGRLENLLDLQLGERDILNNAGGTTVQFTFLDDIKMEAILRAVSKSTTSNIIHAPSITVYNGERAHLTLMKHFSYVKDFEPEIAQSAVIAEPIVSIAKDGIILDVKPVVSSDRRFITMELRPTIATLKRNEDGSLPQFTTGLGVGESVTIELPELEVKRLRTTVTMPDGATLLLGGMKISNEQKFDTGLPFLKHIPIVSFFVSRKAEYQSKRKLLILVTATIVIPEEAEPKVGFNK